jgi:hypothetical protein
MLPVVMENFFMKTVTFTKVIGKMIRLVVMASILKKMELFTKGNGKMTNSMVKEQKYGEIMLIMRVISSSVKKQEWEN